MLGSYIVARGMSPSYVAHESTWLDIGGVDLYFPIEVALRRLSVRGIIC